MIFEKRTILDKDNKCIKKQWLKYDTENPDGIEAQNCTEFKQTIWYFGGWIGACILVALTALMCTFIIWMNTSDEYYGEDNNTVELMTDTTSVAAPTDTLVLK